MCKNWENVGSDLDEIVAAMRARKIRSKRVKAARKARKRAERSILNYGFIRQGILHAYARIEAP